MEFADMDYELLFGLWSSLVGGTIVALITYLIGRSKVQAEVRKLEAEAERTKAETIKILGEIEVGKGINYTDAKVPIGWFSGGSYSDDYDYGVDREKAYEGHASGYIYSRQNPRGFGALMQTFKANRYLGKRLRLSSYIKTLNVVHWAGMWMRVDGPDSEVLGLDNMQNRPIRGSVEWVLGFPSLSGACMDFPTCARS
jgi:hypothetical protein